MANFDAHLNFAVSLIATAPVPAASGTTFSVTAGEGALFPAVPFNVVVWPAGANPTLANAEVLRVTSKGTGDNWTATRTQELQTGSTARSIAVGDQICAAITAKMLTDIEALVTTNTAALGFSATARVPGGRLTLTTATPITVADVLAATTLIYTPHLHNVISLYSGTAWADFTFAEISIAVPATTSQMYDVFVFSNAGVPTLEVLAWTNDTTRATALVKQDGHWCKTGALTRLYVGSFRTTTVAGQTEDSAVKRYVWNYYHRDRRPLLRLETTATWTYTTATYQQANAAAANQVDVIVGVQEANMDLSVYGAAQNSAGIITANVSIGEDSTTTSAAEATGRMAQTAVIGAYVPVAANMKKKPAIGRHFYAWLEKSTAAGATTWAGTTVSGSSGLVGWIEG